MFQIYATSNKISKEQNDIKIIIRRIITLRNFNKGI